MLLSSHTFLACPGPPQHQVRFFSDVTPPPIPKKRLARTVSLPAAEAPPLSPLSPLPSQTHSIDSTLSMLVHVPKTFFHGAGPPVLSLSQLSFDTPDEQLPRLFRNFEDQKVVFQGIQHRQTLFLQSVAQSIDAAILLQEGAPEKDEQLYLPQDFLLRGESAKVGDMVYYSLCSPKLPGRLLALRVNTLDCIFSLMLPKTFFFSFLCVCRVTAAGSPSVYVGFL